MNDGVNNSGTDTDSGTVIAEDAGTAPDVPAVPEDSTSDVGDTNSVSDTVGDFAFPVADTESVAEDTTDNTLDNSEVGMEVSESTTESSSDSSVDYTYELNNIEYWQMQQLEQMQAVQSVSGNSIMVSFDDDSMQALTEIQEKQDMLIDGQETFCGLMGCLVLAVCAEWLIGSAKRAVKNFTGRKE